jgi:nucleoside-diphosphate-sugar epimerase
MTPTALVTGASGFLGSHLVKALRRAGHPVVAWMRTPGAAATDPGLRFAPWPAREALAPAIAALDRPLVFHLAAAALRTRGDPVAMFDSNIRLTGDLVIACAQAGVRGFVHAGSCTEYGAVEVGPPIRESAPLAAIDLYDASKVAAGLWAQAVAHKAGLGFAWARLFGLYGPGLRPPRLLPTVHAALRAGRPVELTPGSQIRDWLYVDDAVDGLLRLGAFAAEGHRGVFNLCTGHGETTRVISILLAQRMNADPGLLRFGALPARPSESPWLVGDPSAANALGWSAQTELSAGLDAMIVEFDQWNDSRPRASATNAAK